MKNRERSDGTLINVDEELVMKESSDVDLTAAAAVYSRLRTKYQSAPPGTKLSGAQVWADFNELWHAILRATGNPCPCTVARRHQLLADCPAVTRCCRDGRWCDALLCECCVDLHYEDHGW